jgi:hypothetical protein
MIATEAKRTFTPATYPTLDELNRQGVILLVSPGERLSTFDTIQNVR